MVNIGTIVKFVDFVKENRLALGDEWFKWMISFYPEPSRRYLLKKDEPFTNPVGYNIFQYLNKILELFDKKDLKCEEFETTIGEIIKIRTLQDIDTWLAVNIFEFLWQKYIQNIGSSSDLSDILESLTFYHELIAICLRKFIETKDKIAEIQKNEIRNRYGKILDRLNEKYAYIKDNKDEL